MRDAGFWQSEQIHIRRIYIYEKKNCSSCISFHNGIRNDSLVALQEQAIPQAQEATQQQTTQQQMTVQRMQTLQKEVLMMKTH